MPLSMAREGESNRIEKIGGREETRKFLENLGFVVGSAVTVITQIGVGFSNIVGGSLVAERVYAFPGIGSFLNAAVKSKDIPIVVGTIIVVSIIVGITNLIVDLLYAVVDPRVQLDK